MAKTKPAQDKLDALGIDALCDMILNGKSQRDIATALGIDNAQLVRWLAADPHRSACAKEARADAAKHWDEEAERVIANATDPLGFQKARELAHHYRWRAKAVAPRDYSDKVTLTGDADAPLQIQQDITHAVDLKGVSDSELSNLIGILTKAAQNAS